MGKYIDPIYISELGEHDNSQYKNTYGYLHV